MAKKKLQALQTEENTFECIEPRYWIKYKLYKDSSFVGEGFVSMKKENARAKELVDNDYNPLFDHQQEYKSCVLIAMEYMNKNRSFRLFEKEQAIDALKSGKIWSEAAKLYNTVFDRELINRLTDREMKEFDVYGQAHGTVSVEYRILAESEEDAKEKASKLFQSGTIGSVKYLDDDASVIDFTPFQASLSESD